MDGPHKMLICIVVILSAFIPFIEDAIYNNSHDVNIEEIRFSYHPNTVYFNETSGGMDENGTLRLIVTPTDKFRNLTQDKQIKWMNQAGNALRDDAILKHTIEKDTSVFVTFESESYLVEDECKIDYFGNWSYN
ncbi:isoleucyl-tRNA synthetase [Methanococcus maripaludis]|uniref:Isoleucyl-tRNA synthetase n=1 Tax=Methanococcus maripaludis TaxID=39152 RepID=A0A7J9NN41_METMI|nr:hypothetical protein [Methanococcus maripaludis]MBA2846168.1 isoleucyl-tRNA synthetase [Methanococcus maripaludis]